MSIIDIGSKVTIRSFDTTNERYGMPYGLIKGGTYIVQCKEFDLAFNSIKVRLEGYPSYRLAIEDLDLVEDEDLEDEYLEDEQETDSFYLLDLEEETEENLDVKYVVTGDSVTLSIGDQTEMVTIGDNNYDEIRTLCLSEQFTEAMALMNVGQGISSWGKGLLEIENGEVTYNGMKMTGKLVERIITMMSQGDETFKRFAKFLNLTQEQESFKTRERLMDFAAHDKLDLNDEGYVVAFKNVKDNYYDKHSGKFRNMVGDCPSMPRNQVDDDHDKTCSQGLHVCSPTYLKGFWGKGGRNMRVVVDPRDFVAIPYDYNDSKARVCKYKVVEDVTDKIDEYLN